MKRGNKTVKISRKCLFCNWNWEKIWESNAQFCWMQIWMFCSLKFSTFFPRTAFSHNIVVWGTSLKKKKYPVQCSGSCERRIWWALYRLNQTYEGRKWDYTRWKWKRAPNTNGFTSKAKSIQSNSIPKSICGKMMWRNRRITTKKIEEKTGQCKMWRSRLRSGVCDVNMLMLFHWKFFVF